MGECKLVPLRRTVWRTGNPAERHPSADWRRAIATPWAEGGRTDLHGLTLVCTEHISPDAIVTREGVR